MTGSSCHTVPKIYWRKSALKYFLTLLTDCFFWSNFHNESATHTWTKTSASLMARMKHTLEILSSSQPTIRKHCMLINSQYSSIIHFIETKFWVELFNHKNNLYFSLRLKTIFNCVVYLEILFFELKFLFFLKTEVGGAKLLIYSDQSNFDWIVC